MSKIRSGDLLRVRCETRVTKHPGYPSINDGYNYIDRGDFLIAVADEFTHKFRMLGGDDILEPYVKVLTCDQHVYFADPRRLVRVTQQEAADKISEKEL